MLSQKETPSLEQKITNVFDINAAKSTEQKPSVLPLTNLQMRAVPGETQENPSEDLVKKANKSFADAEQCAKDKNYENALCHFTNALTNAFLAVEHQQTKMDDMFKIMDNSIRFLADFAAENSEIYKECRDDAKIKFALTCQILSKDPKFSEHIPVVKDHEYEAKIDSLRSITTEKRDLLMSLIENENDSDIAGLFLRSKKLIYKELHDHDMQLEQKLQTGNTAFPKPTTQTPKERKSSPSKNPNSIFNSSKKTGLFCVIPGAFFYSAASAGLKVALLGGFYGFLIGAAGAVAYTAGKKLADNCKDYCKNQYPRPK